MLGEVDCITGGGGAEYWAGGSPSYDRGVRGFGEVRGRLAPPPLEEARGEMWDEEESEEGGEVEEEEEEDDAEEDFPVEERL